MGGRDINHANNQRYSKEIVPEERDRMTFRTSPSELAKMKIIKKTQGEMQHVRNVMYRITALRPGLAQDCAYLHHSELKARDRRETRHTDRDKRHLFIVVRAPGSWHVPKTEALGGFRGMEPGGGGLKYSERCLPGTPWLIN